MRQQRAPSYDGKALHVCGGVQEQAAGGYRLPPGLRRFTALTAAIATFLIGARTAFAAPPRHEDRELAQGASPLQSPPSTASRPPQCRSRMIAISTVDRQQLAKRSSLTGSTTAADRTSPQLGPSIAVRAYLDLTADNSLATYLALRDVHRRFRGEVDLYVGVVSPSVIRGLEWRDLGEFAAALLPEVELGLLLKEIARAPLLANVDARTHTGRVRLATRLGLSQADAERIASQYAATIDAGTCADDVLAAMQRLRVDLSHQGLGVVRPPLYEIQLADGRSELIAGDPHETTPRLDNLASALERQLREHRRGPIDRRLGPASQSLPNRLSASVVNSGMVVGGVGLPHELTIFATAEDDGMMIGSLEEALNFRTQLPGTLAVRIVPAGQKPGTALFGKRLCAAEEIGETLAYARYLARTTSARGTAADVELLSRLDAVEACDDPARALPEVQSGLFGTWLDGRGFDPREGLRLSRALSSDALDEDALWQIWPRSTSR